MKISMYQIFSISLMLIGLLSSTALAESNPKEKPTNDSVDNIVAAGIALKFEYVVSRVNEQPDGIEFTRPDLFRKIMRTLNNDAESFSDTKSGNRMREATHRLSKLVAMVMTEKIPSKNKQFNELLKVHNANLETPDPEKLCEIVTHELKTYVTACELPTSVFKSDKIRDLLDAPSKSAQPVATSQE